MINRKALFDAKVLVDGSIGPYTRYTQKLRTDLYNIILTLVAEEKRIVRSLKFRNNSKAGYIVSLDNEVAKLEPSRNPRKDNLIKFIRDLLDSISRYYKNKIPKGLITFLKKRHGGSIFNFEHENKYAVYSSTYGADKGNVDIDKFDDYNLRNFFYAKPKYKNTNINYTKNSLNTLKEKMMGLKKINNGYLEVGRRNKLTEEIIKNILPTIKTRDVHDRLKRQFRWELRRMISGSSQAMAARYKKYTQKKINQFSRNGVKDVQLKTPKNSQGRNKTPMNIRMNLESGGKVSTLNRQRFKNLTNIRRSDTKNLVKMYETLKNKKNKTNEEKAMFNNLKKTLF